MAFYQNTVINLNTTLPWKRAAGRTLEQVINQDPEYVRWLCKNGYIIMQNTEPYAWDMIREALGLKKWNTVRQGRGLGRSF